MGLPHLPKFLWLQGEWACTALADSHGSTLNAEPDDVWSCAVALVALCSWLLQSEVMPGAWLHYFGCGCMGMLTSFVFIASTQYNTDYAYVLVAWLAAPAWLVHLYSSCWVDALTPSP